MLTKTSSTPSRGKRLERSRARLCVLINQAAFPGVGTILAGRPVGYAQAALMAVGFVMATGFMLWYLAGVARLLGRPHWRYEDFQAHYRPYLWVGLTGLGLCASAWVWSLFSSLSILRQARPGPPPFPVT